MISINFLKKRERQLNVFPSDMNKVYGMVAKNELFIDLYNDLLGNFISRSRLVQL